MTCRLSYMVRRGVERCVFLRDQCFLVLERFEDLLAVSDSSVDIWHVDTNPHGLVHHVEHVNIGVVKDGSHLLQALLTYLQQLTRGCHRVKAASTQAVAELKCQRASDDTPRWETNVMKNKVYKE